LIKQVNIKTTKRYNVIGHQVISNQVTIMMTVDQMTDEL